MAALDVFREVGKIADADFLAMDVLPILWAMSLGPLLNLQQFQLFMNLIKALSSRIETEHTRKLQELSATSSTVANRADFMSSLTPASRANGLEDANGDVNDFESLVLGKHKQNASNVADNSFDAWAQPTPALASGQSSSKAYSRTTSPSATFSWSTPPPPQTTATLRPATASTSRTVTPDQPLNSFATLQPSPSGSMGMSTFNAPIQPMQPMRPSPQTQSSGSGGIDWNVAAASSSASAWSTSMLTPAVPNYSSPAAPSITSNPWGTPQASTNSFSIAPPPPTQYTNFGIAPPPAQPVRQTNVNPMGRGMGIRAQQPQTNGQMGQGQKQGMDKYESLI